MYFGLGENIIHYHKKYLLCRPRKKGSDMPSILYKITINYNRLIYEDLLSYLKLLNYKK